MAKTSNLVSQSAPLARPSRVLSPLHKSALRVSKPTSVGSKRTAVGAVAAAAANDVGTETRMLGRISNVFFDLSSSRHCECQPHTILKDSVSLRLSRIKGTTARKSHLRLLSFTTVHHVELSHFTVEPFSPGFACGPALSLFKKTGCDQFGCVVVELSALCHRGSHQGSRLAWTLSSVSPTHPK